MANPQHPLCSVVEDRTSLVSGCRAHRSDRWLHCWRLSSSVYLCAANIKASSHRKVDQGCNGCKTKDQAEHAGAADRAGLCAGGHIVQRAETQTKHLGRASRAGEVSIPPRTHTSTSTTTTTYSGGERVCVCGWGGYFEQPTRAHAMSDSLLPPPSPPSLPPVHDQVRGATTSQIKVQRCRGHHAA